MSYSIWRKDRKIAYFSMEIGVHNRIPNYAGGLGILAGDTLKSCADLHIPTIAVTLLFEDGFFRQELDENGNQTEHPEVWNKEALLEPLPEKVVVSISGRDVIVQGWVYRLVGRTGFEIPVIYLDTDVPGNSDYDRTITRALYGGDHNHRMAQELILGVGGFEMLQVLGYTGIEKYHLNEGHGSFLILEMLSDTKRHSSEPRPIEERYDFQSVHSKIVFTTHTPVEAGHDRFDPWLAKDMSSHAVENELIDHMLHDGQLNMTYVALGNSGYVNGVAKKHAEVSQKMFPKYAISSITNGVHSRTWTAPHMARIFDQHISDWVKDPSSLRFAEVIPDNELWDAHMDAKRELIDFTNRTCSMDLSPDVFTLGFARRAAPYKRLTMMFSNLDWLRAIHQRVGKIQFIIAGKAHPQDQPGKDLIRQLFNIKKQLAGTVNIAYIPNYNIDVAKKMVSGVDLWINTPQPPMEASGTSGMKAAHNGVPQFSTLDGWWIEGCIDDMTGWSIQGDEARDFHEKLEKVIVPKFYSDRPGWIKMMKNTIAFNASQFNTERMVKDYVTHAYFV
ncbi:TPA: alpha-glucan family phosphorylase [Candidatus Woesearchaeota archaeon]|nr:alpha-glucan family phosphorylase [Candidatus Woesearchaeota archaeon]